MRPSMSAVMNPDYRTDQAASLAAALSAAISGEVRFDAGSRAAYSADASNYRQVPIGVVLPKTADDVIAALRSR